MFRFDKIIGIDPGTTGAIAVWTESNGIAAKKIPTFQVKTKSGKKRNPVDIEEVKNILLYHKNECSPIIFIEHVQAWIGDADNNRRFAIMKLVEHYTTLVTTIEHTGIPYVKVRPQDWQSFLNLKIPGQDDKERKSMYLRFAKEMYPNLKVTLTNSDAACLVEFGRRKLAWDEKWIMSRLPKKPESKLF